MTAVGEEGDAGVFEQGGHRSGSNPVVVVPQDRKDPERSVEGTQRLSQPGRVASVQRDEVAPEQNGIRLRLIESSEGGKNGCGWSQRTGMEIRGKGEPEASRRTQRPGQVDPLMPDPEGR
jgi:hypothetical protein